MPLVFPDRLVGTNIPRQDQEYEVREMHRILREAMATLSERQQAIVAAHELADMTFAEIAKSANMSSSRAGQVYHEALVRLRAFFAERRIELRHLL